MNRELALNGSFGAVRRQVTLLGAFPRFDRLPLFLQIESLMGSKWPLGGRSFVPPTHKKTGRSCYHHLPVRWILFGGINS
ncbi:MAG: hypothetical protein ACK4LB_15530 [Spirosomataceae bacterium]